MKTLPFYLLLFSALSFSSCDDIDDESNNSLKGTWALVKVSGTIAGIENNYPIGKIKWTFTNSNVKVINTDTEYNYDVLESGEYTYTLHQAEVAADCTETVTIDAMDLGCYYTYNNKLYINQLTTDGVVLELAKL
ncbi:hypothetical protein [Flavobacterium sp. GCM10027622]|uniref:hypothetical protein n=1 Tax=unclassified Flavobacterium TaxID=196869 RepID=UPI00361D1405